MFSTLVSGLRHCIQPSYRTLVAISKKFGQVGAGCCRTSTTFICATVRFSQRFCQ